MNQPKVKQRRLTNELNRTVKQVMESSHRLQFDSHIKLMDLSWHGDHKIWDIKL